MKKLFSIITLVIIFLVWNGLPMSANAFEQTPVYYKLDVSNIIDNEYANISIDCNFSTIFETKINKKEIEKNHLNCIVAPHMPSDALGLNLLLDRIESRQALSVMECSGFRRVRRSR